MIKDTKYYEKIILKAHLKLESLCVFCASGLQKSERGFTIHKTGNTLSTDFPEAALQAKGRWLCPGKASCDPPNSAEKTAPN